MNRVSSRIAARAGIRQVEAVLKADAAADHAERAVHAIWRRLMAIIRRREPWAAFNQAKSVLAELLPNVETATGQALRGVAAWGHRSAKAGLHGVVSLPVLQAATIRRRRQQRPLREDFPGGFTLVDFLDPWRDWQDKPPPEEEPTLANGYNGLFDQLFLPPPEEVINDVVFGTGWKQRFRDGTRLGAPEVLANIIGAGLAFGKSQEQIAADLLPHVEGVRVSARRVARTEGMRVAGAMQMQCHEQLGDLVVGYSLVATLDTRSRPWHAARNGEVYYLNPQEGQKGPFQMPHPPDEPQDPRERPAGTPKTAWNCRCTLAVVLRDPGSIARDNPVFTNNRGQLVPDPIDYSKWFERADEQRRRLVVGTRRYRAVADQLGRQPSWAHFLSPSTGGLLSREYLERETTAQRAERMRKLEARFSRLRQQSRDVMTFGFLHGVT